MQTTLYHNPRCSKSRETLALLKSSGIVPQIIDYQADPPDINTLKSLVNLLRCPVRDIIRSGEPEFAKLGLDNPALAEDALLAAVAAHPRLLQRPIFVAGNAARIGRPPESVLEILPK